MHGGILKEASNNDELLVKYLLGDLGEDEQEQVEERYIADRHFYDHLLVVEDDLIDAYVRGELSRDDGEKFESHFLRSPDRRKRLAFARAMRLFVTGQAEAAGSARRQTVRKPGRRLFNLAAWPATIRFAAAALALAAAVWLAVEVVRLRNQASRAGSEIAALEKKRQELEQQVEQERARSAELAGELDRERASSVEVASNQNTAEASQPLIASLALSPGATRGGGRTNELIIPADARQVRLQLMFGDGDYASYRALISTPEGREVFNRAGLRPRPGARAVTLILPASLLSDGAYTVTLSGATRENSLEVIAEYSFTARKK
jgi:hypothetical protein